MDGGTLALGGCSALDGSKVIVRLQTTAVDPPFFCSLVVLRRGATPALFPELQTPAGYGVVDARASNVCSFESSDGTLAVENTAPISKLWGELTFELVFQNRPRSYRLRGGAEFSGRVFTFADELAGCSDQCLGP
jgi:hypothetical protein